MGIPNIHSTATPTSPLIASSARPQQPASLLIGELTIAGRSYTVSVESSEPLVTSVPDPVHDTIEKIEYLVKLHLQHIQSEGTDLNDVVIRQLDEDGLDYVTKMEDDSWKETTLSSSMIHFDPSKELPALPSSLQDLSPSSIGDVFKSIIDSLIAKRNEPKDQTPPPIPPRPSLSEKRPAQRVIFTENFKKETSLTPLKNDTPKVQNRQTEESSDTTPTEAEDQANTTEEQNLNEESNNRWSWAAKKLCNILPRFLFRNNSYEVVDPTKEVKEKSELFLQKHPEVKKLFTDISNLE